MTEFLLDQKIPATRVTLNLIKSLEDLLRTKVAEIAANEDERMELRSNFSVSITDSLGTEVMESIDKFGPDKFSNSTSSVAISFSGGLDTSLYKTNIRISFDKEKMACRVRIRYDGIGAREVANGILNAVKQHIEPYKTGNEWLYPDGFLGGVIFSICAYAAIGSYYFTFKNDMRTSFLLLLVTIVLFAYRFILPALRPYTTFESRRSDSLLKKYNWFWGGLIGFVFFGWLAPKIFKFIEGILHASN